MNNNRICITGTGRSGTTFLVRLFTLIGLDTGYTPQEILLNKRGIQSNCNSGLEILSEGRRRKRMKIIPRIIKDPNFIIRGQEHIDKYGISHIIVPVRNLNQSAQSRVNNKKKPGGLWNANDLESQLSMYQINMSKLWELVADNDLQLTVLSFKKMINQPDYLYSKLNTVFALNENIFLEKYQTATKLSIGA